MIVVWRITQRCNLACPFCSFDRTLGGSRIQAQADLVKRIGAQLAAFQRETRERVLVSWIGGEPFLWLELRAMTELFTNQFGLRVSATTNGTALGTSAVRDLITERFSELTVSVDAMGAAHDDLRQWSGGFATLRAAVSDLAERKRSTGRGPLLRVNTVLMHDTVFGFPDLCRELAEWGVNEISFNQLGGRDRPEFFPQHRLTLDDVAALERDLPSLRDDLQKRGVRLMGGVDYLRRVRASAGDERLAVGDCGAGERFLFIDEQGRVSPCNYTQHTLGIMLDEGGDQAARSSLRDLPQQFAGSRAARRPAACDDCHCTQVWEKFSGNSEI